MPPKMRRFASLDPFTEIDTWNFRIGRLVANEQFLQALLRHGTFDAYHFFLADTAAAAAWERTVVASLPDALLRQRVFARPATELRAALRDYADIQVFHQGDFTYFQPSLVALRNALGRRFVVTGVTHSLDGLHHRFLQLALCGLQPYDAIVCTSAAAQRLVGAKLREVDALLEQAFGKPLRTAVQTPRIPLGLTDDAFVPHRELRAAARASLRLGVDQVVFLSIGRLSMRSKVDWTPCLEQWASLRQAGRLPKGVLLIAGGGTPADVAFLQGLIERYALRDSVQVLANFPAQRKAALLAAADVYLALSDNFQETFGVGLVEAMAAGLPVIAADFDGFRDHVIPQETGMLVPTTTSTQLPEFLTHTLGVLDPSVVRLHLAQMVALDTEVLRDHLVQLHDHSQLRQRLGAGGRQRAEALRWPAVVASYEALWADLAAQAARSAQPAPLPPALTLGHGIEAYSHYASRRLEASTELHLTSLGEQLLADPNAVARMADVANNPAIERAILKVLRQAPCRMEDLRRLMARFGKSAGDADYHALWLLKHGAVRLSRSL